MRRIGVLGAMLALLAWPGAASAGDAPRVVVSLKPIHALASAIMEGVGRPVLIVEGAASEHVYALRPSQAASLETADAIFWVGPVMESYLIRSMAALPKHARIVTLLDRPELTRLPRRAGGPFEPDEDDHPAKDHGAVLDGHLWLDPENARRIAHVMADTLAEIDPPHAQTYAANAKRLSADLAALDGELRRRLAPLRDRPFIVFHDAYQYLEARYGLRVVGSITVDPSATPSAKRVTEIRARIKAQGALCVFSEPQFEPRLVRVLIEGLTVRTGALDPLGASLPPGREAYFTLLRSLADALETCLAR